MNINIAVVGLGQVGIYLLNELNTKRKEIELKTGKKINVVAISARDIKKKRQFKVNKNILKMELEHNLIGNFGGNRLLASLKENNRIKWLNLFGNISLGSDIVSLISAQLRFNRISNRTKKVKSTD